jgi:murein DD-endopeptidase MepM/ murein hydrolase activator NlpD
MLQAALFAAAVLGAAGTLPAQEKSAQFRRGDANADGEVDIADATSLLSCLFLGGRCPSCPDAADGNDDGDLDLSDAVRGLSWLFLGGESPPAPGPLDCGLDPTPDRLADCSYPGCEPMETQDPALADVRSRQLYASVAEPSAMLELHDVQEERIIGEFGRREVPYDPRPGPSAAWNSAEGRRLTGQVATFHVDLDGLQFHPAGSLEQEILNNVNETACTEADHFVSAPDRQFTGWSGIKFQSPANAFDTEGQARNFLLKVHAEQPFFLPFSHPDVRLRHGWYYNDGDLHRACDYSRSNVPQGADPTFEVRSAGDGEVVAVTWDGNGGNVVGVEHTAPGGQKVMFVYLHLRDGRAHDIEEALSSTSEDDKYVKYRAFATNYPEHVSWGTESHTIRVVEGEHVDAGELIGYAGNTGAGGAAAGLDANGQPDDWTGNVHLHVYVAVPHPTTADTWVWVDPYGVYNEVDTGCYDLLKDTMFSRLYAPFYPNFHGVPYEVFEYYFGYYPNMGLALQTVSVHRHGNKLLASGSFQQRPGAWLAQGYLSAEEFQAAAEEYFDLGFVPRETSVAKTLAGSPRFTAIWRPIADGEDIEHWGALPTATWEDRWEERVVGDDWRLEDYFAYDFNGTPLHSVLLTSNRQSPFAFSGLLSAAALDQLLDDYLEEGLVPVNFNVASLGGTSYYSAIFRDLPGCWRISIGKSPAEYQEFAETMVGQGYRIEKIQGYADSQRFGVLFSKAGGCP